MSCATPQRPSARDATCAELRDHERAHDDAGNRCHLRDVRRGSRGPAEPASFSHAGAAGATGPARARRGGPRYDSPTKQPLTRNGFISVAELVALRRNAPTLSHVGVYVNTVRIMSDTGG